MDFREIVQSRMLANDGFSKWLGIKIIRLELGVCHLSMTIRAEMSNGFGIAHGGIPYSLADSALAFAANTYGLQSLTIDGHLHYFSKIYIDDQLEAHASMLHKGKKISKVRVDLKVGENLVAQLIGAVIHTKVEWD